MTDTNTHLKDGKNVSELEARDVAEAARETQWKHPSFVKELFLGNFRLDLIHPYPLTGDERPEFREFYEKFKTFLKNEVDPAEIDRTGFYRDAADKGSRSRMNVTFRLPSEELEAKFVKASTAAGLDGLKGHRSVGGMRASIYNAFPEAGVTALVEFMREFERTNG